MDINTKLIKTLAQVLSENGLSELEIEQDGLKVRLSRDFKNQVYHSPMTLPTSLASSLSMPHNHSVQSENIITVVDGIAKPAANTINAKMVGVFYSAASPDSDAFVSVGKVVSKGDVICIIEAMKTMNEIVSDVDCEIVEILANNGQLVDFGQPLFKYKVV